MITVEKGSFKMLVTRETFEEQLKPLGYQIASKDNKGAAEKVAPFVEKEEKIEKTEPEKVVEDKEKTEEDDLNEEFGFKKGKKGSK